MIQSIPRKDTGGALGAALGGGLQQGFNMGLERQYAQAQKQEEQSRLKAALGDAEKIYNDQSKTIAQKRIGLAQALQNYPEHAKQLTQPLNELELQEMKGTQAVAAAQAKPQKLPPVQDRPVSPEQKASIDKVKSMPGFDDLDEVGKYDALIAGGVSPTLAKTSSDLTASKLGRETAKYDKSFNDQKDFIEDTTSSYSAFESQTKPRLLGLQRLAEGDLVSPTANAFLETVGIPLGALEDPSSELYHKLSQDLLKGLPESYGSRILKVEVDNFLRTIPTLANSSNGRRMIASNLLKLGEMKEVFYREMRKQQKDAIDNNKPLPKDFQQRVLDNVLPQLGKVNQEFMAMSDITDVPEGTVPFFNPQGGISFITKGQEEEATKHGGKRIW